MYRTNKKLIDFGSLVLGAVAFAAFAPAIMSGVPVVGAIVAAGVLFVVFFTGTDALSRFLDENLRRRVFSLGDTRVLGSFVDRLRFCFTTNDLINAFRDILEFEADSTILLIDMPKHYAIYTSPGIIGTDPALFNELVRHYDNWREGCYFFDDKLDLVSDHRKARGFFLVKNNLHIYCFMRFVRNMEVEIFDELYSEFQSFLKRNETIEKMFSIAAISKEWTMVADTQKAFLPKVLPRPRKLELASYFRPLVNVSGDYYDVLPIDEDRTLVMLGDVSGKGLAAALVMGIVVNTIRIIEKKDDLEGLVRNVDAAIKGMKLQDKYTVLFLGIIDTKNMVIRYINASMADPLIISETKAGRQVRTLPSNCQLIGILELENVVVAEAKLFDGDVILMASDGVSEVANPAGDMLGDTEKWNDFITEQSSLPVNDFVQKLADLVIAHSAGASLRDDVTVLAAKVQE